MSNNDDPAPDGIPNASALPDLPVLPDQAGDLIIPLPEPVDENDIEGTRYRWDEDEAVFHLWVDHGEVEYFPYSTDESYVQDLLTNLIDTADVVLVAPEHFPYNSTEKLRESE